MSLADHIRSRAYLKPEETGSLVLLLAGDRVFERHQPEFLVVTVATILQLPGKHFQGRCIEKVTPHLATGHFSSYQRVQSVLIDRGGFFPLLYWVYRVRLDYTKS